MKSVRMMVGLLLCALVLVQAGAQAVMVDYDRQGSLEIRLEAASADRSGVVFSLYRIGEINNDLGGIRYEVSDDFKDSGVTLDYETSQQAKVAAQRVETFIKANAIAALATAKTNGGGVATFAGLSVGVYFVRASGGLGRLNITPFIVSVPHFEDGKLEYAVKVFPKLEVKPTARPTASPTASPTAAPTVLSAVTSPPTPTSAGLPQTGVLRWPIIALCVAAAAMIALGIYALKADRERKKNKS